jgi:hypothetical protein
MEILDVFKDINNQVVQRQLKQISVFPDTLKPKTERDLGAEVNVDKAVEQINRTLEQKLGTLEFFLQNVRRIDDPRFSQSVIQSQEQSTNTGDVIPLYNTISRTSHQTGLSRESRQVIRVQLQALTPNLDALLYGLSQAVQRVMKDMEDGARGDEATVSKSSTSAVLDFLRTYAVYQFIRKQVDRDNMSSVELLTVEALNTEFRNAFEQLSQNDITLIKERLPNANYLLSQGMKNVPDFPADDYDGRIKALEDELGFKIPPTLKASLKQLPLHAQKESLVKIKSEASSSATRLTPAQTQMIRRAEVIAQSARDLVDSIEYAERMRVVLESEIKMLSEGARYDPERAEELYQLVPPVPAKPVVPQRLDYPNTEEWERAFQEYELSRTEFKDKKAEADEIEAENQMIKPLMEVGEAERLEEIRARQEAISSLTTGISRMKEDEKVVQAQADALVEESGGAPDVSAVVGTVISRPTIVRSVPDEQQAVIREVRQNQYKTGMGQKEARAKVASFNERHPSYRITITPPSEILRFIRAETPALERERELPVDDEKEEENVGEGMASRGLGSLRRNYGFRDSESEDEESESESDSDPLDFDDRRNEHYYTRPR